MQEASHERRPRSAAVLVLLPFLFTVLIFGFVDGGSTLDVHRDALIPGVLLTLALTLPIVVAKSMRQLRDAKHQLDAVPAYKFSGSWTFVIFARCLLVGSAGVVCVYLWIRILGERMDGELVVTEARVASLSTGGNPKGGCSLRATLEFGNRSDRICASRSWHQPLLPENVAQGDVVACTVKTNRLSTSVVSIKKLE